MRSGANFIRNFDGDLFTDEDGDTRSATQGYGVTYRFWGKGLLSAEADFTYNPKFLGDKEDLGSDSNLLALTVNGIIGPRVRAGSQIARAVLQVAFLTAPLCGGWPCLREM